jgi:hypothetical protein
MKTTRAVRIDPIDADRQARIGATIGKSGAVAMR